MRTSRRKAVRAPLLIVAPSIVGVLFVLSGWAKLVDPHAAQQTIALFAMLKPIAYQAAVCLGIIELSLGLLLVLQVHSAWILSTGILLLSIFILILVKLAITRDATSCGCFGAYVLKLLGHSPIQGAVRNVFLILLLLGPLIREASHKASS